MRKLINIHSHVFNYEYVPEGYLGVKLPFNFAFLHFFEGALWAVKWLYKKKTLENYKRFLDVFNSKNSREVYNKLVEYDTELTTHIALGMDMISIEGKCDKDVVEQIKELGAIKSISDNFEFFVAIDPTREPDEIRALLNLALKNGAIGYKMYPSLGYLPSHPHLMEIIYPFCIENKWAVTTHCSSAITHSSSKRILVIGEDVIGNKIAEYKEFKSKDDYLWFNEPVNYEPVLRKFPKLHINFAHYGGSNEEWRKQINSLMYRYRHVYADLSYTFSNYRLLNKILHEASYDELICSRILYGTDFYMVLIEGDYEVLLHDFHKALGDTFLEKFGRVNPLKFLKYD